MIYKPRPESENLFQLSSQLSKDGTSDLLSGSVYVVAKNDGDSVRAKYDSIREYRIVHSFYPAGTIKFGTFPTL